MKIVNKDRFIELITSSDMKTKFAIAVLIAMSISSCTNNTISEQLYDNQCPEIPFTKGYGGQNLEYFVSESDLDIFVQFRLLEDKSRRFMEVSPLFYEGSTAPTAYLIQYEDGWDIVAADKRMYPIIFENRHGRYVDYLDNLSFHEWLTLSELDIIEWRLADGYPEISDAMKWNLDFWDNLINPSKEDKPQTKAFDPRLRPYHDVLIDVLVDTIYYDRIPHLVQTHWNQDAPYNDYCPLKPFSTTERCPAGCAAVSSGQMLYFLYSEKGMSLNPAPTEVSGGNLVPGNPSVSAWDNMGTSADAVAVLLRDIGCRLEISYTDTGSVANPCKLPDKVFAHYGVLCSDLLPYQADSVINSLSSGMPVIAGGYLGTSMPGHSFIIDRYERSYCHYTNVYQSFYLDGEPVHPIQRFTFSYDSSPFISEVGMNWGYGTSHDGLFYTLNGTWYPRGSQNHYDYDRDMILGYSSLNQ